MLFLDGELQSAEADERVYHETLVHPVMAAARGARPADAPLRVLVVGGGEGATVREVLRWSDVVVDWVDIDADLVALCREHLGWWPAGADEKVSYYGEDICTAWGHLRSDYNVVILDLPDPDGETGVLYSDAFWHEVVRHLAPDGWVATHCGPVRPFENIGGGFQRIREMTGDVEGRGFYRMGIPSFQGDWGFWVWSRLSGASAWNFKTRFPVGLEVVDERQIAEWANPARLWRRAVAAAVNETDSCRRR
jgi:spermidine synthase